MKEACQETGLTYDTLKFYCNEGLVPFVQRNKNNQRIFFEHDLRWIKSLDCLKKCKMSIAEMKEYLRLCLEGESTIPERKRILELKQEGLKNDIKKLQAGIDYINWKQDFYDEILSGKRPYFTNLKKP